MENDKKKTMSFIEMAELYHVTNKTLNTWIKPIRKELLEMYPVPQTRLRTLFPKQIKRIQEFLD